MVFLNFMPERISIKKPMITEAKMAGRKNLAPKEMPTAMDQNIYTVSIGSFTAVRKRTIDNAPTMPKDNAKLLVMGKMINEVTIESITSETPKFLEYITPLNVLR